MTFSQKFAFFLFVIASSPVQALDDKIAHKICNGDMKYAQVDIQFQVANGRMINQLPLEQRADQLAIGKEMIRKFYADAWHKTMVYAENNPMEPHILDSMLLGYDLREEAGNYALLNPEEDLLIQYRAVYDKCRAIYREKPEVVRNNTYKNEATLDYRKSERERNRNYDLIKRGLEMMQDGSTSASSQPKQFCAHNGVGHELGCFPTHSICKSIAGSGGLCTLR